jgi:hypothetical protein
MNKEKVANELLIIAKGLMGWPIDHTFLARQLIAAAPGKNYPPASIAQWMKACKDRQRDDLANKIQKGWENVFKKYPKTRINWATATIIGSRSIQKNVFGRKEFHEWMESNMDLGTEDISRIQSEEIPPTVSAPAIAIPGINETPEDWRIAASKTAAMLKEIDESFETTDELIAYLKKESTSLAKKIANYGPGGSKEFTSKGRPSSYGARIPKWTGQLKEYSQKMDEVESRISQSKKTIKDANKAYNKAPVTTVAYEEGFQNALDDALERILNVTDLNKQEEMLMKFNKMVEKLEKERGKTASTRTAGILDQIFGFFDKAFLFLTRGLKNVAMWVGDVRSSVNEVDRWASVVGR